MLIKGSNVSPSIRIGIIKLRIFSVYSNNNQIKFFGVIKGSVSKSNRLKKSYLGLKLKCYLLKTKKTCSRIDGSGLFLYRNVMYINHKKLKKFKKNYGICQKIIKHRKYIFKFPFLLLMFNNINRPNTNIKFFLLSYDIEQFNILVFTKLNFNLFINSLNFLFFFIFFLFFFYFFFII